MKNVIPVVLVALLASLSPALAKTNRVSEAKLRGLSELEGTELQEQLASWMVDWDLFPLGWTNTVATFQMGDHLRPALTNLVGSSHRNVSRGAKNLLKVIGHPDDVEAFKLFRAKHTRTAVQAKSLDDAIKRGASQLVAESKSPLNPPGFRERIVDKSSGRAVCWITTSSKINQHASCYRAFFSRKDDEWKMDYYILDWIQ